jgi:hypothetical protein
MRAGIYADLMWYPDTNVLNSSDYPIVPRHTDGYILLGDDVWEGWVSGLWWGHREVRNERATARARLNRIRTLLDRALMSARQTGCPRVLTRNCCCPRRLFG